MSSLSLAAHMATSSSTTDSEAVDAVLTNGEVGGGVFPNARETADWTADWTAESKATAKADDGSERASRSRIGGCRKAGSGEGVGVVGDGCQMDGIHSGSEGPVVAAVSGGEVGKSTAARSTPVL